MAVNLSKGQKVSLFKGNKQLSRVTVGLGWSTNKYKGRADFDLDASAFLLNGEGKVTSDKDFVFYNNPKHPSGAIWSTGDNRTGSDNSGDDEQLKLDLLLAPDEIQKIVFVVTIYEAKMRKQNFGLVSNAFIRVMDTSTEEEIARYDLTEDFSDETAAIVGTFERNGANWEFKAVGDGFKDGLEELCRNFGVNI